MTTTPFALTGIAAGYGNDTVLEELNLELQPGTITGLLGRNGSGKTTMMRVALGLMKPTAGQATLFEAPAWKSPRKVRQRIGYVPQNFYPLAFATVDSSLKLVGGHYDAWDQTLVDALRQEWRLGNGSITKLSPGNQQKVSLLMAMGHRPDLLVLDEPVASLDPGARREFLRTLVELNADRGQTVLLSSHITSDVERVCSHIAVLHNGRIVCHVALDEIKDRVRSVTLPDSTRPPADHVLAQSGNRYWLWDPGACELAPHARLDDVVLEDLFLAMTA